MHRVTASLIYSLVLLPVWAWRRLTGGSRFGRSFHKRQSTWDVQSSRGFGRDGI
jgi:hypothetical protein